MSRPARHRAKGVATHAITRRTQKYGISNGARERAFIVWVLFCVPIYVVFCLMWFVLNGSIFPHFRFWLLIQFLFSLQNLVAALLTAHDVQMRSSLTSEQKLIWLAANLPYLWNRVGHLPLEIRFQTEAGSLNPVSNPRTIAW